MIRSFQNVDMPEVARVWRRNAERLDFDAPAVDSAMMERALVTRVDFAANDLQIIQRDDEVIGWCHRVDTAIGMVGLVAFDKQCDVDDVAELLTAADCHWIGSGVVDRVAAQDSCLRTGPRVLPYSGLQPLGFGVGVLRGDRMLHQALSMTNYTPVQELEEWSLDPARFRPPINRQTMALRRTMPFEFRSSTVGDCTLASRACHLERHLAINPRGESVSEVQFYASDPEFPVMPPTVSLFAIPHENLRGEEEQDGIDAYVLGLWIAELAKHGVRRISTTLIAGSPQTESLAAIGFSPGETGMTWQRGDASA